MTSASVRHSPSALHPVDLFGASASGLHPVGERIALWLADIPAKVVARDFAVAVHTAKGWKRGHLPLMAHFAAMVTRWGDDFLDFAFAPALAEAPSLSQQLDRMEKRAAQFSRDLAELKQQVTHEKVEDQSRRAAGAGGDDAGSVAGPGRARGRMVSRAIGLGLLLALAAPILSDAVAPAVYASVLDLGDQGDDPAARLHKVARRPLRLGGKRELSA
ncbi:hypothetical protein [Paramagnetospirillum magneticum]|uniref:Uncharacterized protein n=1 Tax=Paramagnetospirillum magneticum (strain ATCC 700264 / AMB-1) TaxID=342108 RepID=Q2W758_PARM1|nr:hypothetical protein [Paramagnetospirillum magneticum]BAE50317.1 hypothetical protein amb1513 [Paramagnetospirillum magneticum AMB-1]